MHYRNRYRIPSIRLAGYDYSSAGWYFITVCTKNREQVLNTIVDGEIFGTEHTEIILQCWFELTKYYHCILDEFIIMPDHIHGIVHIPHVERIHEFSLQHRNEFYLQPNANIKQYRTLRRQMMLPKIIGRFKMRTAKLINQARNTPGEKLWQPNYYERIIRSERELHATRQYVRNNPVNW